MQIDLDVPTLMVFSHPNHEIGVFGFLQRLKPHLAFLTDGGGEERVNQTRRGLERLGLLDRAVFFNETEAACYRALLSRNAAVFVEMAARLRVVFRRLLPAQVFCDAVEFYNPVHDVALPVVLAAMAGERAVPVFEIPLISQRAGEAETFRVQRPDSRSSGDIFELRLTETETAQKLAAFHETYHLIRELFATSLSSQPLSLADTEALVPARSPLTPPAEDDVLRYERRARLLKERGEIVEEITWGGHYVPTVTSLLGGVPG